MLKKLIFISALLVSVTSVAQSAYDSLKKVYGAQYIFEQREKGDSFKFIKDELSKIKNPELKQLAACAITENVYGYGFVDNKKLTSLLEDVIANPQTERAYRHAQKVKTETERSLVGTNILPVALPDSKEDTLSLANYYTAGFDYTIIDLWATWCGPCIAEMKKFNELKKQYNIEFYSISVDEEISKVQKFVKRNPDYTWPIVFAGKKSSLMDYFKVRLIPAFIIVDRNGIVISHVVGKGLEDELKKLYKK